MPRSFVVSCSLLLVRGRLARVGEPRCQPTRHLLNAVEHLLRIPRFVGFREQSHSSEAPRGIFDRTSDVSSGLATITFAAIRFAASIMTATELIARFMRRSHLSSTRAIARLKNGPSSKAAELFCAGTSNCRIRCVAPRHGSPAAFLDEGAPIPRGNLVERDELGCCIGLLLEFLDADRSQRCYDCGFSALGCHFLSGAAECPSERRKPYDRERDSADYCTPYRWFHPGMDLHFVTLHSGRRDLLPVSTTESYRRGEPAKVDSETTQRTPAPFRMSDIGDAATAPAHRAAGCRGR